MRYLYILSAFLFCFQDCGSCDLNPPDCERTYRFDIPLSVSPTLDTFSVGDTLFLYSFIPTPIEDLNTGEVVDIHGYDFKIETAINRVDTLGGPIAEPEFDYIFESGRLDFTPIGPVIRTKVRYETTDSGQVLKVGLVPKRIGLYKLGFYNLTRDLFDVELTDEKCRQNLEILFEMNGNKDDNNFHLMVGGPVPINSPEGFKRDGGYVFRVLE